MCAVMALCVVIDVMVPVTVQTVRTSSPSSVHRTGLTAPVTLCSNVVRAAVSVEIYSVPPRTVSSTFVTITTVPP